MGRENGRVGIGKGRSSSRFGRPVGKPVGSENGRVGIGFGKSSSLFGKPVGRPFGRPVGRENGNGGLGRSSSLFGSPVGRPVGRLNGKVGKTSSLLGSWVPLTVVDGRRELGNIERLEKSCLLSASAPVGSGGRERLRLGRSSSLFASLTDHGVPTKALVGNGMPERLKLGRGTVGSTIGAAIHSCAARAAMNMRT